MRYIFLMLLVLGAATANPAQAARILIMTDPMTLERRMVVIERPGRDRVYLCATPPAVSGCREITQRAR